MKLNQQNKKIRALLFTTLMLGLASCGEQQESNKVTSKTQLKGPTTGILMDAGPVAGIAYTTSSGTTGTTDAQGVYHYNHGDNIKFQLGGLVIGEIKGTGMTTPIELAGENENKLRNLSTLLQSLDSDNDLSESSFLFP